MIAILLGCILVAICFPELAQALLALAVWCALVVGGLAAVIFVGAIIVEVITK
jgi:hypothetical protein